MTTKFILVCYPLQTQCGSIQTKQANPTHNIHVCEEVIIVSGYTSLVPAPEPSRHATVGRRCFLKGNELLLETGRRHRVTSDPS